MSWFPQLPFSVTQNHNAFVFIYWFLLLIFFRFFRNHLGYLYLSSAFLTCFSSSILSSFFVISSFILCRKVLIIPIFCLIWWLDRKSRYWSVWMVFLYIVILIDLSYTFVNTLHLETKFSAHVYTEAHNKQDFQYSILCTEDNWYIRGIKEAIAIRKLKPSLNKGGGRYNLSTIYDDVIHNKVCYKTART